VTIFPNISKGKKKILSKPLGKPSTILANISLATDQRCWFINPTIQVFVVTESILLFSSEVAFYGVTGFENDSKIGEELS
jgi:hypothetical protein